MKKLHYVLVAGFFLGAINQVQTKDMQHDSKNMKQESHAEKRDLRILQDEMKKFEGKQMSHHELNSFVYRIECLKSDARKNGRMLDEEERKVKRAAVKFAKKQFYNLASKDQYGKLERRIERLSMHHKGNEHNQSNHKQGYHHKNKENQKKPMMHDMNGDDDMDMDMMDMNDDNSKEVIIQQHCNKLGKCD